MGNKRITEKDFWMCTNGAVPAQLQGTNETVKKFSGEKYITIQDKATSSWIDFGCTKLMLIYALLAAAVVVIAAMTVATGGAALIALGALAGLAGAAWGAVVGSMLCGHQGAKIREWIKVPKAKQTLIQGVEQVTGDYKMSCMIPGGMVTFAPQIKNWSQAVSLGASNYLGKLMEGMMAGAAVGMGGALISGGAGAFASGGMRGIGQAAWQFAKSMPKNFYVNAIESVSKFGLALRGVMGVQNTAATYGNTGEASATDFLKGTVAMETGAYDSFNNIKEGKGTWQDYVGMAMMFAPVGQGKRDLENSLKNEPESTGSKADDAEGKKADEEDGAPKAEVQDGDAPKQEIEAAAYSDQLPPPEFETITLPDGTKVKRLKPNSQYEINGYKYKTDAQGRIINAKGRLSKDSKGGRNPYAQRTVGKGDGRLPGDHGGHLIGDQFGGAGGKENMVPMDGGVNNYHKGKWGQMEKKWSKALDEGKTVDVDIEPIYTDDSGRPSSINVTENIDGNIKTYQILNK